jgi:hypothetical protein
VFLLLAKRHPKQRTTFTVLNVGVVGSILSILVSQKSLRLPPDIDVRITASDLYEGVVGTQVHGVTVEHGTHGTYGFAGSDGARIPMGVRTLELIADADMAIVTGMTLTNGTLDAILETAIKNKTALVIFAETGAHFATEYCNLGVDVVVSEPFPFYLTCDGPTRIDVYRRNSR